MEGEGHVGMGVGQNLRGAERGQGVRREDRAIEAWIRRGERTQSEEGELVRTVNVGQLYTDARQGAQQLGAGVAMGVDVDGTLARGGGDDGKQAGEANVAHFAVGRGARSAAA